MGQTTPKMSIYIPSNNETGYATSFAVGMNNIDQHDHSGAPNKGVPIASNGILDGSVTAIKLNADVLSSGGGLAFDGSNAIKIDANGVKASMLNTDVLTVGGGLEFDINNTIQIKAPVSVAKGGTNATSFGTANGVVKYDGTRLVASSAATYDSSNRYRNTAQPAFSYFLAATTNYDLTGDGTVYQLGSGLYPLTKIFDQGNNFNVNGTFTAPVTGVYQITAMVVFSTNSLADMDRVTLAISTTLRTYYPVSIKNADTSEDINISGTVLADMTAGDIAVVNVSCYESPSNKSVAIVGNASLFLTGIQGHLVC